MKSPAKHTLKGLHGHCYSYNTITKIGKTVCITRSEIAKADFDCLEYELREKLSKKWKVCLDCWAPNPTERYFGRPKGKPKFLIAYSCDFGKCKAWGKPYRIVKGKKEYVNTSLPSKGLRNK